MGVAALPILVIGSGVLEAVDERLFEMPILLLGIGWTVLGVALAPLKKMTRLYPPAPRQVPEDSSVPVKKKSRSRRYLTVLM